MDVCRDGSVQAGVLVFAPRVTEQTIRVPLIDDTTWEANETFLIKLANPRHADTVRANGISSRTHTLSLSPSADGCCCGLDTDD